MRQELIDGNGCIFVRKALKNRDVEKSFFHLTEFLKMGKAEEAHALAKALMSISSEASDKVMATYKESISTHLEAAPLILKDINKTGMPEQMTRELLDLFSDCAANKAFS